MTHEQTDRASHQLLADFIKGVHAKLRNSLRQSGDFGKTWSQHVGNQSLLADYAEAMRTLANDHWEPNCSTRGDVTRIAWCVQVCRSYFQDGGLQRCLEKDHRRLLYHASSMVPCASGDYENTSKRVQNDSSLRCCGVTFASLSDLESHRMVYLNSLPELPQFCLPLDGRIRLLDVGSCYNPFRLHNDFVSIGLDLCPAGEDVLPADFLALDVFDPLVPIDDRLADKQHGTQLKAIKALLRYNVDSRIAGQATVTAIPGQLFHAVVFSLLLEYLPEPRCRWLCCVKAHRLLLVGGLLLVVTPDSSHVGRRAQQMKDWRRAIEAIGFSRFSYDKLEHVHCMAFRKTSSSLLVSENDAAAAVLGPLMHIPQDDSASNVPTVTEETTAGGCCSASAASDGSNTVLLKDFDGFTF